ncbi:hypothetical protein [Streptomyces mesophilus]|uniref:hypothetical protein n=1 Tax=Streptomyces mesophilus TaxID=1775132 RepID=UPI003332F76E
MDLHVEIEPGKDVDGNPIHLLHRPSSPMGIGANAEARFNADGTIQYLPPKQATLVVELKPSDGLIVDRDRAVSRAASARS